MRQGLLPVCVPLVCLLVRSLEQPWPPVLFPQYWDATAGMIFSPFPEHTLSDRAPHFYLPATTEAINIT